MDSETMRRVTEDEPVMVAWIEYQKTPSFANILKWNGEHGKSSAWAAFVAGWGAAGGVIAPR